MIFPFVTVGFLQEVAISCVPKRPNDDSARPISGLHCIRLLLEGVSFREGKVIEQPEHGIFLTDVFGEPAIQRVSEIHILDTKTLFILKILALT